MCRFVAYSGAPACISTIAVEPPFSLVTQARTPRLQRHGTSNPDGFGLAWYQHAGAEPERYRSSRAIGDDPAFLRRLEGIVAPAFIAHVRSATPGSGVNERNAHPFVSGRYAFAHNGSVDEFTEVARPQLIARTSRRRRDEIEGTTDSEVLFALALDALDEGCTPASALARVVEIVTSLSPSRQDRLNLVLTDGMVMVAVAWGDTLFTHDLSDGAVVASEPFDDEPGWLPVPDRSIVQVASGLVRVDPLAAGAAAGAGVASPGGAP